MIRFIYILITICCLQSCDRSKEKRDDQQYVATTSQDVQSGNKLDIGSMAPEFSLPDRKGRQVSLSDFRGKYVFLDFWASWCLPCRKENPDLVRVYNKFKGQNFEMLGIAFDKKREKWIDAIQSDGLEWPQVSDLKYFDSEMIELYSIVNVPTTMLVDPEGKIVAMNLHADELENLLSKLL
jgi:peroxiredoxin